MMLEALTETEIDELDWYRLRGPIEEVAIPRGGLTFPPGVLIEAGPRYDVYDHAKIARLIDEVRATRAK